MTQQVEEELTIQQVTEATGVNAYTLRYYERIGLLDGVERASSGHRRYTNQDMAWISMLRRLRSTGMSIRKMQEFANLRRQGEKSLEQRLAFLEQHQQEVLERLHETEAHLAVIDAKIKLHRAQIARKKEVELECFNIGELTAAEHLAMLEDKIARVESQ
ncbi:MerR family transcriptional regulator [Ktedonospora formicarum]|uniref:HTH merR-type domain-containing protein n=1 Tax=Ktedonospora formicarum TaxID=2778364 RepID=A0A8J3I3H2_9CHLR|nr:MerR family transcriptional regulator [Ktedonospora formicarum]GHO46185.1 hypothetical protein KSX_43480 [Ktedonospora formicarum]